MIFLDELIYESLFIHTMNSLPTGYKHWAFIERMYKNNMLEEIWQSDIHFCYEDKMSLKQEILDLREISKAKEMYEYYQRVRNIDEIEERKKLFLKIFIDHIKAGEPLTKSKFFLFIGADTQAHKNLYWKYVQQETKGKTYPLENVYIPTLKVNGGKNHKLRQGRKAWDPMFDYPRKEISEEIRGKKQKRE